MAQEGTMLRGTSGKFYRLTKSLGRGGEGTVFATDDTNVVAKIYHNPEPVMERKLKCMTRHPLDPYAGSKFLLIAWPQDVIYENGKFVGYIMPFIKDVHPIYVLCRNNEQHIQDCHAVFPKYNWTNSIAVAYNLAIAVRYIHENGYVVGDMNPNNIVIHGNGSITILDVDSFDVTDPDTGEHFKCKVGVAEMLPPELQGRNLKEESARFTKHTDEFSLAIHIFQLLMNNQHPFNMRRDTSVSSKQSTLAEYKRSIAQDKQLDDLVKGNCVFIRDIPGYTRPLGAPSLEMLPAQIQTAFRQTFDYTAQNAVSKAKERTSADMWRVLLYNFYNRSKGTSPDLVPCAANPEHYYLKGHNGCAFCKAEQEKKKFMDDYKSRHSATQSSGQTPPKPVTPPPAPPTPPNPSPKPAKKGFFSWLFS